MFRSSLARLGKIACYSRYESYGCIYSASGCKLFNTESASKVIINNASASENKQKMLTFVDNAYKIGLDIRNVADTIRSNFTSSNIKSEQFLINSKILLDFGFTHDTVVKFMKEFPSIFFLKNTELEKHLNLWQELEISGNLLIDLFSKHPQFIEIIGPEVLERIAYLLPYFRTHKTIGVLLLNAPIVIYENWDKLKAKLDYLHSHNIPMNKVASCNALSLSLLEMKTRFIFLERAGLYNKVIDLEKKKLKRKNPTVRNILCSDNKLFAETISRLSLEEFEAFIELYKFENEFIDEDNDEVDSE